MNLDSIQVMASADVFISDYSGGLLDAVAGGIPTLCFADDLDHYRKYLTDGFIDEKEYRASSVKAAQAHLWMV